MCASLYFPLFFLSRRVRLIHRSICGYSLIRVERSVGNLSSQSVGTAASLSVTQVSPTYLFPFSRSSLSLLPLVIYCYCSPPPGPCPPCPKTLNVSCHCGRSPSIVKRCGVRGWMCGRVCGRELDCGLHSCEQRCHDGIISTVILCVSETV